MGYTNTTQSTSISGWSGSNGRVFTLSVTAGPISGTQWKDTMTVSVNWNDSYWYDSHLYVWEKDMDSGATYTRYNQTAGWSSGVWFTQPGTSGSWEDTWTRTDSNRTVRIYVTGYVNQYSDRESWVQFTIPAKKSITVTFNGNGATSNTFGSQTFKEGNSNQSFTGSVSRTGYTMLGWSTSSTATSATYSTNSGVADSWIWDNAPSITLYAVWQANKYPIYYNANGGTGAPATQTKTSGVNLTLQAKGSLARSSTTATITRTLYYNANGGSVSPTSVASTATRTTSYTATGWNTASNGGGTSYAFSGTYSANVTATMYAVWSSSYSTGTFSSVTLPTPTRSATTATVTRTLYFNANGGTVGTSSLASTAVKTTSYTQTGWYSSTTNGTRLGAAGASYVPAVTTAYAHWTLSYSTGTFSSVTLPTPSRGNTTSTVTRTLYYDAQGGTVSPTSAASTATLTTSYTQTGWYSSSTNGTKFGAAGAAYTPTATQTAYAHWTLGYSTGTFSAVTLPTPSKSNTTSTISRTLYYNANGGTVGTTSVVSTATLTTSYTQTGWYSAASGGTKFGAAGASYTPTATQTAYAHWTLGYSTGTFSSVTLPTPSRTATTATTTRTVYFNANGGTTTKASQNATATVTTTYTQTGWYSSSTNGTRLGAAGAAYTPAVATAYAHWTLTYSTGTFSSVTLPTMAQCSRTAYHLIGFNTASAASTATYSPGATYPGTGGTAYAIWRKILWVWNGSEWKKAIPWVWNGSAWKETSPWTWNGSAWK